MHASEGEDEFDPLEILESRFDRFLVHTTGGLVLVLVFLSVTAYFWFGAVGLQALSIVVVGALAWLLIGVYYAQAEILRGQSELLETQLSSTLDQQGPAIVDGNEVYVELANRGRGEIRAAYLETEIDGEFDGLDVVPGQARLTPVEGTKASVPLRPFAPYREFSATAEVGIGTTDGEYRQYPFDDVAASLRSAGHTRFDVTLRLVAEDPVGVHEVEIGTEDVVVGESTELSEGLPSTYGGITTRSVDESFRSIMEAF